MSDSRPRQRLPESPGLKILGPVLTVAVIAIVEITNLLDINVPNPPAILMTLVVFSAFAGGLSAGLIATIATCIYLPVFYADSRIPLYYSPDNLLRVIVSTVTVPAILVMAAISKRRGDHLALQWLRREQEHSKSLRKLLAQREKVEADLKRATADAEAASLAKSEFIANVSHEVRTPMNGIIGMTELVLDSELTREQREHLEAVRSSADALLTIINDLLDFSKIDAGKLELQPVPFDVQALLSDVARSLALRAHEKGLELVVTIDVDVPAGLRGDALRLRQVLVNLVSNAIKFTDDGEVVLSLHRDKSGFRFTVRDTGIGIAEEKQEEIFDAFTQADGSATRRFAGTGLGLTISSRLVDAMGGTIAVKSKVGKGSTFTVMLPLEIADDVERISHEPRQSLYSNRVLVVDDNRTARTALLRNFEEWGIPAVGAASGVDAMAALRGAFEKDEPFTLLLCDARMSGMDGFTLIERMRSEIDEPPAVVMMLTTSDQAVDADRCSHWGVAEYVIKPVRPGRLLRALSAAASERPSDEGPVSSGRPSRPAPPRALRILVAEDNAINATLMRGLLERQGHEVSVVGDGEKALDEISKRGGYDLAVLDVQMPVLGGMEVAWLVREEEKKQGGYIPMIAVTAHAMKGARESCLKAGFDAYMCKPIRPDELFEAMDAIVPSSFGLSEPKVHKARRRSFIGQNLAEDRFDPQLLLRHTGHDVALARELVKMFLEEYPPWVDKMRKALDVKDARELQRVAHMVKGAVSHYGAETSTDLALILERMGRDRDLINAPVALAELEASLERLRPALAKFAEER